MKKIKNNSNKNSKAVSPLIATLLLIAVALVVAGILYVWANAFGQERFKEIDAAVDKQISCAYAGINITGCDFNTSSNIIKFKLNNTGTITLTKDFTLQVDDGNSVVKGTYTPNLTKGDFVLIDSNTSSEFTVTSGAFTNLGTVTNVRMTPTECPTQKTETTTCTTST